MAGTVYTGIDIGSDSVKVLSLRAGKGGYTVLGAGSAHVPAEVWDSDNPEPVLAGIVRRLFKSQKIPKGHVVTGLSGRGSMLRYMSMPIVPPWKLGMLLSYEVEEQAGALESAYDYRILDLPEFEEGKFSLLLAQAQEEVIDRRMRICAEAKAPARDVDMLCMALHNLYLASPQYDDDEVSLCLDIGCEETLLSLQQGESLFFARSISQGGRHFTDNIRKEFEVSQDSAEQLKLQSGGIISSVGSDNLLIDDTERISNACKAEASALSSAIQGAIVFFRSQALRGMQRGARLGELKEKVFKPTKVYLTGGACRLPGLCGYLGSRLGMECELLDVESTLPLLKGSAEVAFEEYSACHFAAAAGLALSRASRRETGFTLITEAEKERRELRERKIPLVMAGGFAFLFILFSTFASYSFYGVEDRFDKGMRSAIDNAKNEAKKLREEWAKFEVLDRRVMAVEERLYSGRDLLEALRVLRVNGNPAFVYTRLEFQSLEEEKAVREPEKPKTGMFGSMNSPARADEGDGIIEKRVSRRAIVINGLCFKNTERAALDEVDLLVKKLEKDDGKFFAAVKNTSSQWTDDAESLAKFKTSGEVARVPFPRKALNFSMTCWLRDWR